MAGGIGEGADQAEAAGSQRLGMDQAVKARGIAIQADFHLAVWMD
jgi:hypothetical protein